MTQEIPNPTEVDIVNQFGNCYVIEDDTGERKTVPKSREFDLVHKHDLDGLVENDIGEPVTLSEDPLVRVASTHNSRVYTVWVGEDSRPVQNPPADTSSVLDGVLEAVEQEQTTILEHLYEQYRSEQVREDIISQVQAKYEAIPPEDMRTIDKGWVICDTFLLTWRANVYLVSRDFSQPEFDLSASLSYTENSSTEFLALAPRNNADSFEFQLGDSEEELRQIEIEFFGKAYWLSYHRNYYDDDLFWEQVYQYVHSSQENQP